MASKARMRGGADRWLSGGSRSGNRSSPNYPTFQTTSSTVLPVPSPRLVLYSDPHPHHNHRLHADSVQSKPQFPQPIASGAPAPAGAVDLDGGP
eukprot:1179544-Prorocentrum_minimum.AAC.2